MASSYRPPRPGVVTVLAIVSFLMSALSVLWVVIVTVAVLTLGVASWIGGPIIGLLGTAVAGIALIIIVAHSILSLLLFLAAWNTWRGNLVGLRLHRLWAWIVVVIDVLDLLVTAGLDAGAWIRLIYAVFVLYATNQPEVRAYFESDRSGPPRSQEIHLGDDAF